MEKDSKTTVAVERTTFAKLDRLAKANSVSKMEYITDSTIRKNQEIIFKRIEASETAQIKAYKHIVSFLDAKGKTGLLDDINKVYEREKERRGL